jgi:hypothetical protein
VDKFFIAPFGFHASFITKLSTINSRELVNKAKGEIHKNITSGELANMKFEEEILVNSFFLSADEENVYFNLLEIQYSSMLQ